MSSLPKEIKKINLKYNEFNQKKKYSNRINAKPGRIKSQDDRIIFSKKFSTIDKNNESNYLTKIIMNEKNQKNLLKKMNLNSNRKNSPQNYEDILLNRQDEIIKINFSNNKIKTLSEKSNDIYNEQSNLISLNSNKLRKNFFEDIKIKNIIHLWNELDILKPYRKYFFFIYKEINDENEHQNLYENEINELIELKNNLKNLAYNIELRIGIIKKLSELNDEINIDNKKTNKFIIDEMAKEIEKLTEITVNIVLYMKKIKILINSVSNLGKYNIDLLAKKFNFDKNYIIKMKSETIFLREGYAQNYFNFKNDESPFFLNADENNNKQVKRLALNKNVLKSIKECNYYIYKELIAYQNEKANKKLLRCISPLRKNISIYNYSNINFYNNKMFGEDKRIKNDNDNNYKKEKEKIIINGNEFEKVNERQNNKYQKQRNSQTNINKINNSNQKFNFNNDETNLKRKNKKLNTLNQEKIMKNKLNVDNINRNKNNDIDIQNFENNKKIYDKYNFQPENDNEKMKQNDIILQNNESEKEE